jgi:hypothetical protein
MQRRICNRLFCRRRLEAGAYIGRHLQFASQASACESIFRGVVAVLGRVQLVIALVVTPHGFPLACDVMNGISAQATAKAKVGLGYAARAQSRWRDLVVLAKVELLHAIDQHLAADVETFGRLGLVPVETLERAENEFALYGLDADPLRR